MANFPQTSSGDEQTSLVEVAGNCVTNANSTDENGVWQQWDSLWQQWDSRDQNILKLDHKRFQIDARVEVVLIFELPPNDKNPFFISKTIFLEQIPCTTTNPSLYTAAITLSLRLLFGVKHFFKNRLEIKPN